MKVWLLRHGRTAYNGGRRYQGRTDVPLSPEGAAELVRAEIMPPVVYVSPLCRTGQTAARMFPAAKQVVVKNLAEMDFGAFEGRNYVEMEQSHILYLKKRYSEMKRRVRMLLTLCL